MHTHICRHIGICAFIIIAIDIGYLNNWLIYLAVFIWSLQWTLINQAHLSKLNISIDFIGNWLRCYGTMLLFYYFHFDDFDNWLIFKYISNITHSYDQS